MLEPGKRDDVANPEEIASLNVPGSCECVVLLMKSSELYTVMQASLRTCPSSQSLMVMAVMK